MSADGALRNIQKRRDFFDGHSLLVPEQEDYALFFGKVFEGSINNLGTVG